MDVVTLTKAEGIHYKGYQGSDYTEKVLHHLQALLLKVSSSYSELYISWHTFKSFK